jgi:hypothetical protein
MYVQAVGIELRLLQMRTNSYYKISWMGKTVKHI